MVATMSLQVVILYITAANRYRQPMSDQSGQYQDVYFDQEEFVEEEPVVFSRGLETFFTMAVIFSTSLMPFVLLQTLAPDLMTVLIASPLVWLLIPYVLVMVVVGLKISSLFGCSAWTRITQGWQGER